MQGGTNAARLARVLLLAAAGVLALYLLIAPKPWSLATGPEFFAPRDRTMVDTILTAWWWMAIPNLVLCVLAAVTAGWWAAPVEAPRWPESRPAPRRATKTFVALLLLAAAFGGALRWNLAHGSLWWDEAWTVRRVVVGYREPLPEDPARLEFKKARWHWTLFHYKKPTNHVLYSIAARISNDIWRARHDREPWAFDEFAMRLPAFLASLASIVAVGFLLRRWASSVAGVGAAFFLALHPWHVEHGPELRAYGFVGLLTLLACFALPRVLRTLSARSLAAWAAIAFALLWSHPLTIYLVASFALFGLVGLLLRDGPASVRLRRAARFTAAHVLVGMLWLQVMAPNLAQVPLWTDVHEPSSSRVVRWRSLDSLIGLVTIGFPREFGPHEPDGALFPSVATFVEERPTASAIVGLCAPLLLLAGLVRLGRRRGPERWAALGLAFGAPLGILTMWLGQLFFHERFVFYALIAVVVLVSAGLDGLLRAPFARVPRVGAAVAAVGVALALAGFHSITEPRNRLLRERPYAPMREVGSYLLSTTHEDPLSSLRLGYGSGADVPDIYDPWIRQVHGADEIARAMAEAKAAARDLYVFYGYPLANRPRHPDGFRYLDDPAIFETKAHFLGADPHFSFWVLRWTGVEPE